MDSYEFKQFERQDLNPLLDFVSLCASKRWPNPAYLMTSDLAWRIPAGAAPKENIRLVKHKGKLIAYGWFTPHDTSLIELHPSLDYTHPLYTELMEWLIERASHFPAVKPWLLDLNSMDEWAEALSSKKYAETYKDKLLFTSAFDCDQQRVQYLLANEFVSHKHAQRHLRIIFSPDMKPATSDEGIVFRHVLDGEIEKRCQLHRNAWPNSTFSIDQYLKVRNMPNFEAELDVVSENAAKEFGAYCIGWADKNMQIGSIEPLGTHKYFRGKGLAEKVIQETLYRMGKMDLKGASISTTSFNEPAFNLYKRCGFQASEIERTYSKVVD